jgi:pyruvate ferredoxin oxidoreductase gamma subunit
LSRLVSLDAVAHAIRHTFKGAVAEGNVAAAAEAFAYVERELEELAHAQAD